MSQKGRNLDEFRAETNRIIPHLIALAREISESATLTVYAMFEFFREALDAEQTDKAFFTTLDIAMETFRTIEIQMVVAAVEAKRLGGSH